MSDRQPLDEDLVRLFEDARTELPSEAFLEQLERRVTRVRGYQLAARIAFFGLLVVAAAVITPYVTRGSLAALDHAARWVPDLGLALSSPVGWVCSLIAGAWVLKRSHVFER